MNEYAAVDLHIHTALSPCCNDDMTPNNIVNMSLLNGLDAIAITDHNSAMNVEAVMKAAKGRIIIIPGVEIQTREEVHLLCYFKSFNSLLKFQGQLNKYYDGVANNPNIFGNQLLMDENDHIIGEQEQFLLSSLNLSIDDVVVLVNTLGGLVVPAHVDRPSYSIISQLGFIPPGLGFKVLEFAHLNKKVRDKYENYKCITSSDAHYLYDIFDKDITLDLNKIEKSKIYKFISP